MTIAIIIVVCIVLAILAFLLPRLSRHPQKGVDKTLGAGQSAASSAPGKLGYWLQKPFQSRARRRTRAPARGARLDRSSRADAPRKRRLEA